MKSPFKIIFIHGWTASSNADWYPNISKELIKLKVDFAIPDLPGELTPHADEWLEVINNEVIKSSKPSILVGHSLGSRAVLLYLEKYRKKIEKIFLIAAFANRLENAKRRNENYKDFFEHIIDVKIIKPLVGKFYVLHSRDDSSIPYSQGEEIAKDLNAQLITYEDRDHFSEPENAKFVLEILRRELNV